LAIVDWILLGHHLPLATSHYLGLGTFDRFALYTNERRIADETKSIEEMAVSMIRFSLTAARRRPIGSATWGGLEY
jgi:hypothetical protein